MSSIPFYRGQWHERTHCWSSRCPLFLAPLLNPPDKFVQILTGWYLNIGKPLPSVAAIQSAIRSEPTFIRNSRYRFHLSASTSNKSPDRFRGIAHLTKNNREQTALWTNRGSTSTINSNMNYCFVNNNVCFGWRILRSVKIVLYYFPYATILKLWLKKYYLLWRRADKNWKYTEINIYLGQTVLVTNTSHNLIDRDIKRNIN